MIHGDLIRGTIESYNLQRRKEVKDDSTTVSKIIMDPHVARNLRPPEIDTLVELLQSAFPDNEKIKKGLIPLLSTTKAYIKILLDAWDVRNVPALSTMESQQTCNDFFQKPC